MRIFNLVWIIPVLWFIGLCSYKTISFKNMMKKCNNNISWWEAFTSNCDIADCVIVSLMIMAITFLLSIMFISIMDEASDKHMELKENYIVNSVTSVYLGEELYLNIEGKDSTNYSVKNKNVRVVKPTENKSNIIEEYNEKYDNWFVGWLLYDNDNNTLSNKKEYKLYVNDFTVGSKENIILK